MDIKSPALLKLKAVLFLIIGLLLGGLLIFLIYPVISWQIAALSILCIWAFCWAYYFCFYVLQHYADPTFRYAGLFDLFLLSKRRDRPNKALQLTPSRHASLFTTVFTFFATPVRTTTRARGS
jgi:dolichol kinase